MAATTESRQGQTPRPPMDEVAAGFQTKSDKIRALSQAGYSRAEIARHLDIRYQHVRNVLVDDERSGRAAPSIQPAATSSDVRAPIATDRDGLHPARVRVEANGRVSIPAEFCRALGLNENEHVIVALEDDAIRLMSVPSAVKRAQAIVRRFVPPGVSLVDELIAERRAEGAREDGHD
jgi:AbrB family looped-hinge helix DNA binding protein